MAAAMHGRLQCVKLLLSHSADIHVSIPRPRSRSQRQTAASLAAKHGHDKVYQYLQGCIGKGGNRLSHIYTIRLVLASVPNVLSLVPRSTPCVHVHVLAELMGMRLCMYALNEQNMQSFYLL